MALESEWKACVGFSLCDGGVERGVTRRGRRWANKQRSPSFGLSSKPTLGRWRMRSFPLDFAVCPASASSSLVFARRVAGKC